MKIYAGNLHFGMTEDELKNVFEAYGEVSSVKIITDKYTGRSKGYGFIEMPTESEAKQAIDELNGKDVKGRNITVNKSIERKEGDYQPRQKRKFNRRNYQNNE